MNKISGDVAITLARRHVEELSASVGDSFQLIPEAVSEFPQGWVFYYNTTDFIQSGNASDALAGNGPVLIGRDGKVFDLPSGMPIEAAIKAIYGS